MKKLLEQRGEKVAALKAILDAAEAEDRGLTEEEETRYAKISAEVEALDKRIERQKQVDEMAAQAPAVDNAPGREDRSHKPQAPAAPRSREEEDADRALAFAAWFMRDKQNGLTEHHLNACQRWGVDPAAEKLTVNLAPEARVMTTPVGSGGGFAVPEGFVNRFERALLAFGGVRKIADVMRTSTGEDLPWPMADDTSNTGSLLAEASSSGATATDLTLGQSILKGYQYTSDMIRVSKKLLRDNAINLGNLMGDILGERIARAQAAHFTTGTGSGQPQGFITGATSGVTTASSTAITADELNQLMHSVDPAYRMGNSVSWVCNDAVLAYIGRIKDGMGRYLFREADGGPPARIFGFPVLVCQQMSSTITSGDFTVAFGDFSRFKIRDVGTVDLVRLDQRYGEFNQIAFVAFAEADSLLLDAGTHPIKYITQA